MREKNIKSNLWKFFLIILTERRNYIAILSLYFLTLPNSTAQQIGLYTGIGWLAGFLLEIPSGYISDKLGHKKAIILSKISLLLSTISFISGTHLINFILGSIFISIGISFSSGTKEAFLHNTLLNLKKEKDFSKIFGKIQANVSLISAFMILSLPILTKISMVLPIKVYIILDILGLLISFTLINPKIKYTAEDIEGENIFSQIKKFYKTGFYPTSIFFGIIGGYLMGVTVFNVPYANSLGLPIIFSGAIMGISRLFWFFIGHNLKSLKKVGVKKIMAIETILLPTGLILASITNSFYLVVLIFAFETGYTHSRNPLINEYFLSNFLKNKRYKATMISIKSQIKNIFETILVFIFGIIMGISFKEGYFVAGLSLLIVLIISYKFTKKYIQ